MINFLPYFNCAVFIMLASIHLYWAIGGSWASHAVIPTDGNGRKIFRPGFIGTFIVAAGLFLCAFINLIFAEAISQPLPPTVIRYSVTAISLVFLIRAIGDFRYIGFSKLYRKTNFARMDTRYFSPLCLLLALTHFIVLFTR